jgi:DNA polymerase-3 subunit gamma/tau
VQENKTPIRERIHPNHNAQTIVKIERNDSVIENTGTVSIKKMLEKVTDEEAVDPNNLPKNEFSEEEMLKVWHNFAYHIKSKDEEFFSTLSNPAPILKSNFLIEKLVYNKIQASDILKNKTLILDFIKAKLKNYFVDLEVVVDENIEVKAVLSPREKLDKLLKEKPIFALLKEKLKLDL